MQSLNTLPALLQALSSDPLGSILLISLLNAAARAGAAWRR